MAQALKGCALFVHNLPVCNECAKAIIQSGIKKVYMDTEINERRQDSS